MKPKQTISKPWPFDLPEDGWFHLAPRGAFAGTDDLNGEAVTQLLDDAAFDAIVADFNRQAAAPNFSGILIDYDHFSKFADKATVAAGWITELQVREDGLWFRCRWSDTGESNLKSGCYRFISPVFGGDYTDKTTARPMKLLRAGLTNDPNFKTLRPLSNRAGIVQEPERKEPTMKKLLALLGLSPEASEETAVEKVQALIAGSAQVAELENRATKAEGELSTLKAAMLKADADAFCDTHEALIENRAAVHGQFLKDPEGTKALFGSMKAAPKADATHTTLHNRAKKQPGQDDAAPAAKSNADVLEGKVQEYISTNRCSYMKAFDAVSRANPELLKTQTETDDQ
jgi:phage I-like protein